MHMKEDCTALTLVLSKQNNLTVDESENLCLELGIKNRRENAFALLCSSSLVFRITKLSFLSWILQL